ncbi:DUF3426 domain-containing protein [Phenylobacterium sp.]|uniref:DUF3426 domain-containing protein n=1 Tax=Phenylobacterium sp. TaxID=1871053 RepID=UPI0025E9A467|nr:DUF3426 domain-containing protein [Phenylobacterium sp.]MBX3482575.1 zinc-ribbon domain-containing protein [Phenylobacterium sp.]MCW5759603.1 zinc-ribbon domain-containing protein [Phenylobacterium sp.]
MILTCPECATSYFVDELNIPRLGRMVKCTNCAARWRAFPEGAEAAPAPPEDDLVVEAPPAPAPVEDDLEVVAPLKPRSRKPGPKAKKPGSKAALIATAVVAGLVVVGGAAVLLRGQIAGMVPGAAPLFAAIGLPVNMLGLGIEGVVAKETFVGGRPVLAVTGAIRSTAEAPAMAPPIRISLLDKEGKTLSSLVAEPLNAKIPPGAKRYFAVNLPDPPSGAHELQIAFDPGAGRTVPTGEAQSAPVEHAAPAAAAPVEAQPLPAGSPDALHTPAKKPDGRHE